jgi:hypothetical protein
MTSAIEQAIKEAFEQGGQNKPPYEHKFIGANQYWLRWLDANGTEYTLAVADHWMAPLSGKHSAKRGDGKTTIVPAGGGENGTAS